MSGKIFHFYKLINSSKVKVNSRTFKVGERAIVELDISSLPTGDYILKLIDPFNRTLFKKSFTKEPRVVGKYILEIPLSEDAPHGIHSIILTSPHKMLKLVESFFVENKYYISRSVILSNFLEITNDNPFSITDVKIHHVIPSQIPGIQEVRIKKFVGVPPSSRETDFTKNEWAMYNIGEIMPYKTVIIGYYAQVSLKRAEKLPDSLTVDDFRKYTSPEPYIESDDPTIKRLSELLYDSNFFNFTRKIQKWLHKNIKYKPMLNENGAKFAIRNKYGDCTEFSALFVALCRAANIPSRLVAGIAKGSAWENHAWAECYYNNAWIQFEPTWKHYVGLYGFFTNRIIMLRGNWMGNNLIKDYSIKFKYIIHEKYNKQIRPRVHVKNKIYVTED
ncbi:MAG: transglutaminase domain-containing protein [Candidatus Asgardarchaeia archaeon]